MLFVLSPLSQRGILNNTIDFLHPFLFDGEIHEAFLPIASVCLEMFM